jgi:hypothetical protein
MEAKEDSKEEIPSVFQKKYDEFVEDLLGALPEYKRQILLAQSIPAKLRLDRFQAEVKFKNTMAGDSEEFRKNPTTILPGVTIVDALWETLSDNTKKAIWEHVRVLSVCCFMEAGFGNEEKPKWMDDAMSAAMEDMKKKLESVDFQSLIKKFMNMMKPSNADTDDADDSKESDEKSGLPNLDDMFKNGFPKLPERFLKGHMARLAQEIVKDITPADLGISPEMMKDCEKDPSRSIQILFSTFTNNPGVIQQLIGKIGKRLQQKVMSGSINPQEIAREAEELMKEFAGNSSFVDMMGGIKSAFGFEDMDMARAAGKEGSARLATARDRLRKKLEKKKAAQKK